MRQPFSDIDHVQLAMPPGMEASARDFYSETLGMTERPKPPELSGHGGCWFASGNVQIHLGVEKGFRPARKAHPALRCSDYDGLLARLRRCGIDIHDESSSGTRRCHISDPFGNRIELIDNPQD